MSSGYPELAAWIQTLESVPIWQLTKSNTLMITLDTGCVPLILLNQKFQFKLQFSFLFRDILVCCNYHKDITYLVFEWS